MEKHMVLIGNAFTGYVYENQLMTRQEIEEKVRELGLIKDVCRCGIEIKIDGVIVDPFEYGW